MSTATKILAICITLVALVAVGFSGYLASRSFITDASSTCDAGDVFDCDQVLDSSYAKWLGIPVAALGAVVYLAIAIVAWPAASTAEGASTRILVAAATAAVGSGIWFVTLQLTQVNSLCMYCLAVHVCGLLVAVLTALMLFLARSDEQKNSQASTALGIPAMVHSSGSIGWFTGMAIGLAGVALLTGGQMLLPGETGSAMEEIELTTIDLPNQPVETESELADFLENKPIQQPADESEEPRASRLLGFAALASPVDASSLPILGDAEAGEVMIKMFDYTCRHCRVIHGRSQAARKRYGDDFAVALWFVPLNSDCNDHLKNGAKGRQNACEYAKLAYMVWRLEPDKFEEYHEWLMQGYTAPPLTSARQKAIRLVGDRVLLDKRLQRDTVDVIRNQCDAWSQISTKLPVLLFPEAAVRGGGKNEAELFEAIEKYLELKPKSEPTTP